MLRYLPLAAMTPQEIIKQVQLLPVQMQREVLQTLSQTLKEVELSETEVAQALLANGTISEIPDAWSTPDEDFEPVEIKGKPLSERILEDRD